jgi:hypothetical protein
MNPEKSEIILFIFYIFDFSYKHTFFVSVLNTCTVLKKSLTVTNYALKNRLRLWLITKRTVIWETLNSKHKHKWIIQVQWLKSHEPCKVRKIVVYFLHPCFSFKHTFYVSVLNICTVLKKSVTNNALKKCFCSTRNTDKK